ncbi:MAG: orotidine-5'-phosphate decarboxylase [Armatimonadetes bacterium]|nr:orotidine-5'-phosphate decarboxylase [Armatimonadota bacterium]
MNRKVICALDTTDLNEALDVVKKLRGHVGGVKVGHSLTLGHGLEVVSRIQDAGIDRVFLDLKFHDIPNTVALAVREAARLQVWMLTVHISGGPAMMTAASEEAHYYGEEVAPLLMGVSVLTSLDQHVLTDHLGVCRSITEQMVELSKLGLQCGLDGVISSPMEVKSIRAAIGHGGIIATPGIRLEGGNNHDQVRVGTATQALADGANYLVIGRPLMSSKDIPATLAQMELVSMHK